MTSFIYNIYRFFSGIAYPFLYLLLFFRLKKKKENPKRWKEKLGFYKQARPNGKLIWLHVASVGELKSCIKLAELFLQKSSVLITSCTLTSSEIFEKINFSNSGSNKAIHAFAPLDSPIPVKRFLEHFKPNISCFIESEIWPNLLHEAAKVSKVFSVNTRFSPKSLENWKKHEVAFKWLFSHFTAIMPQSKELALEISKIIPKNVFFLGNLKYDTKFEANTSKAEEIKKNFEGKVAVFASTHGGEEEALMPTFKTLLDAQINIVLIPRHPERALEILNLLAKNEISSKLRSKNESPIKNTIYIADTIGETAEFYKIADVIFMGGSLVEIGGHNILEPAKLEKAIICGSSCFNFKEIVEEFVQKKAIIVANAEEIPSKMLAILNDEAFKFNLVENSKAIIKNSSIAENIFSLIQNYENS